MQDYIPQKIDINGQIGEIVVKQFDNLSRFLNVQINDKDLPDNQPFNLTGCTARLFVQVGDTPVYLDGEIADEENGVLSFNLTSGLTQTVGKFPCEIRITNAEEQSIISTRQFTLTVLDSLFDSDALEATATFSALENALFQVAVDRARLNHLESMADAGTVIPGTVEAEVAAARIGGDGTVYSSLRDSITGQISDLADSMPRPATAAEIAAAFGEDIPDQAEEIANDLQNLLDGANQWNSRISAVETRLSMTQTQLPQLLPAGSITADKLAASAKRTAGGLQFQYLADSFVERQSGNCWSAQFMTVGDGYMYVFREGESVTNAQGKVLTVDGEYVTAEEIEAGTYIPQKYGHIQKLSISALEANTEIASAASEDNATAAEVDVQVGHGGGACYGKIGDNWYLIVAPGGDEKALYFLRPDFGEWENTQSATLRVTTGDVSMSSIAYDGDHDIFYRIIQQEGDNGFHRTLQRFRFDANFGITDVVDVASVAINYYQGLCYCDGLLYTVTYGSNCIIAIDTATGGIMRRMAVPLTAGASLMTEPEAVYIAKSGDVYVYGSCNLSGNGGISNSMIWKSNLVTGGTSYPYLLNVRNTTDGYWIHAVADSEDGSYDFTFKRGNSNSPCNSIWTALMMAYAHYINGRTGAAMILWNIPMTRAKYVIQDLPFRFYLTTADSALIRTSDMKFSGCNAAIDVSSEGTLTLEQGMYTVNATFGGYSFERGAVATIEQDITFGASQVNNKNCLIIGRHGIYTRHGTLAYTPYPTEQES